MDRKGKRVQRTNGAFIPIFHVISSHRCDRKFPRPVIRRGRISRPDSNRCVRSNVRESQARTLSAGRSARVTTPFSFAHPVARRIYLFPKPLFASFLSTAVSLALSLPATNAKISTKREKEREKERRGYYSSKLSLYISVRLTLTITSTAG